MCNGKAINGDNVDVDDHAQQNAQGERRNANADSWHFLNDVLSSCILLTSEADLSSIH